MALQLAAKDRSINQPLASLSWEGGNIYRQLTAAMVNPGQHVRHYTKGCMALGVLIVVLLLGYQVKQNCIYAIPPYGALVISPVLVGLFMEKTQNKSLLKAETLWYRSTCLASLSWESVTLAYHPRELVHPANL